MVLGTIAKLLLSLALVVILIFCALYLLRKVTNLKYKFKSNTNTPHVANVSYIDDSTKIIHVVAGDMNYILAVGKNNTIMLDKYKTIERNE